MTNLRKNILTYLLSGVMALSLAVAGLTAVNATLPVVAEDVDHITFEVDQTEYTADGKTYSVVSDEAGLSTALSTGQNVILANDVVITSTVLVANGRTESDDDRATYVADITLNGNGYTVTTDTTAITSGFAFQTGLKTITSTSTFRPVNFTLENVIFDGGGNIEDAATAVAMRLIRVPERSTLNIGNGAVIQNFVSSGDGVFYITKGTLNVQAGGTIVNCGDTASYSDGTSCGSVVVITNGGTMNMTGGTIQNCRSFNGRGGAIGVMTAASFLNISGGVISGCQAVINRGGAIVNRGTMTMTGGTIENCTAAQYGGAIEYNYGSFEMSGGTIRGCRASKQGGAIYMQNGRTFSLSGSAVIENCSAAEAGGAIYVAATESNAQVFNMTGGSITGNSAEGTGEENGGGGVFLFNGATMNFSGGTISNNCTAQIAGGIYLRGCKTGGKYNTVLNMTGGLITGNYSVESQFARGGAVYGQHGSVINLAGGEISGNVLNRGSSGDTNATGGVQLFYGGSESNRPVINLSGNPVVRDNVLICSGGTLLTNLYSSAEQNTQGQIVANDINLKTNDFRGMVGFYAYIQTPSDGNSVHSALKMTDYSGQLISGLSGITMDDGRTATATLTDGQYTVESVAAATLYVSMNTTRTALIYRSIGSLAKFSRTVAGAQFSSQGDVKLSVYVKLNNQSGFFGTNNPYAVFFYGGQSQEIPFTAETAKQTIGETEYFELTCSLPVAYLHEQVSMRIGGNLGESELFTYSFDDYADYLISHSSRASDMLKAMSDMGYAAYNFFAEEEDKIQNPDYAFTYKDYIYEDYKDFRDGNDASALLGQNVVSYQAHFESVFALTVSVDLSKLASAPTAITVNGQEVEFITDGDVCTFEIENIYARDILTKYRVVFTVDGENYAYNMSVGGWAFGVLNNNGASAEQIIMAKTTLNYGVQASNLFRGTALVAPVEA